MRISLVSLVVVLLACGSTPPVPDPSVSDQGSPEVLRFATSAHNTLTVWRTTATGIQSERTFEFPDRIIDINWIDADTPVVLFEGQRLVRVVDGAIVALPSVPATAWDAPRPTSPDYDTDALEPDSWPGRLVAFEGQVWIMRCLWKVGTEGGSDYCASIRWVRVHPTFAQQNEAPELPPLREPPTVAAPEGYTVFEREERTPEGQTITKVACEAPGQAPQVVRLFETDDPNAQRFEVRKPRWIRTSPPRFVVTTVLGGMDSHDAEVVVDGCPSTLARIIAEYRIGPAGLWAWSYGYAWQLEGAATLVPPFAVEHLEFAPSSSAKTTNLPPAPTIAPNSGDRSTPNSDAAWTDEPRKDAQDDCLWLQQTGATLNRTKTKRTSNDPIVARGCDLTDADLRGMDLSHADLTGARLTFAFLLHTNLSHANLADCDLRYTYWERADLENATLDHANLEGSTLHMVKASGADFSSANLSFVELHEVVLNSAVLRDVRLDYARTDFHKFEPDVQLTNADLKSSSLRFADISNWNLTGADLSGAALDYAKTGTTVVWTGATCPDGIAIGPDRAACQVPRTNRKGVDPALMIGKDCTALQTLRLPNDQKPLDGSNCSLVQVRFERRDLRKANFAGADLTQAEFIECDLEGADLQGATLLGTSFKGSKLTYARMSRVNAVAANFDGTKMEFVDLSSARVNVSSFFDASIVNGNLQKSQVQFANLGGADLSGANFQDADLSGASLAGANLGRANLLGAIIAYVIGDRAHWQQATCPDGTVAQRSCSSK